MADKTFDEVRPDKVDEVDSGSEDSEAPAASQGEASEGPSGLGTGETSVGGADSVPGTPDALPYRPDETENGEGRGRNLKDGSGDGLNEV